MRAGSGAEKKIIDSLEDTCGWSGHDSRHGWVSSEQETIHNGSAESAIY